MCVILTQRLRSIDLRCLLPFHTVRNGSISEHSDCRFHHLVKIYYMYITSAVKMSTFRPKINFDYDNTTGRTLFVLANGSIVPRRPTLQLPSSYLQFDWLPKTFVINNPLPTPSPELHAPSLPQRLNSVVQLPDIPHPAAIATVTGHIPSPLDDDILASLRNPVHLLPIPHLIDPHTLPTNTNSPATAPTDIFTLQPAPRTSPPATPILPLQVTFAPDTAPDTYTPTPRSVVAVASDITTPPISSAIPPATVPTTPPRSTHFLPQKVR